jgi:catechol 2,3-dioxygenase-like lactoylglutathione lyase family enzyme
MVKVSISIDVPNLPDAIRFYTAAFGFEKVFEPVPGVVVMRAGGIGICLLEKHEGSIPAVGSDDRRRYGRHWTPVHMDVHVQDLQAALARALGAGARQERLIEDAEHGSVVFCSDPFGHGFCLIEERQKPAL